MGLTKRLLEEQLPELPPEAYDQFFDVDGPFNPDNHWLESASTDDQKLAIKSWFLSRYCDPAMETPYEHESGYMFIHGGPYNPAEEIHNRFAGIVPEEVMNEVISELYFEVGEEWAPINYGHDDDYDYDDRFSLQLIAADDPLKKLRERIEQASKILDLQGDLDAKKMAEKLVFGGAITILESFLWEIAEYWVENNEDVLRNFVEKIPKLKNEKIELGQIFERHQNIKEYVKGFLQNTTWHNWNQVVPIYRDGLQIDIGNPGIFEDSLIKRHDIIHRSGHDKNGESITIDADEIARLHEKIEEFATRIDAQLFSKHKPDF